MATVAIVHHTNHQNYHNILSMNMREQWTGNEVSVDALSCSNISDFHLDCTQDTTTVNKNKKKLFFKK